MNTVNLEKRQFNLQCDEAISQGKITKKELDFGIQKLVKLLEECNNKLPGTPIVRDRTYYVIKHETIEICYTKTDNNIDLCRLEIKIIT